MPDAPARGIDRTTKISLGLVGAALVVAIGVLQPVVAQAVSMLLQRERFEAETEMRLEDNEAAIVELKRDAKKQLDSLHRIEVQLGTLPGEATR
ncbi:MAG: hypothetical protein AAFY08_15700 [Planctomycetota bacterium]